MKHTQKAEQMIQAELNRVMPLAIQAANSKPITVFMENGKLGYTQHKTAAYVLVQIPQWTASDFKSPQDFADWVKNVIYAKMLIDAQKFLQEGSA